VLEKNWSFAAYELHELEESFERVARYWPQWRKKPIADMMTSVTKDPMAAVDQAIKSADAAKLVTAYAQLTEACNTCHQSAEVGMIVIKVPESSPFPDQDFQSAKRYALPHPGRTDSLCFRLTGHRSRYNMTHSFDNLLAIIARLPMGALTKRP
jgi:hypothetical protein